MVADPAVLQVLDKGYVRLRDHMGSDLTVVDAARVSFDKQSEWRKVWDAVKEAYIERLGDRDIALLHFLADYEHWSPFSHPHVMLEVKAPVMVVNQWYKHRIGSRFTEAPAVGDETFDDPWNEMSGRYVSEDLEFYQPTVSQWRSAPASRKQGSGEPVGHLTADSAWDLHERNISDCLFRYNWCIDKGIAPEQARLFLPYAAMYTKLMWTPSLYTVMRFLRLREDSHAQWEIREYAHAVRCLVEPLFPESFTAFEEVAHE